jgi:hypothetical protein
MILSVHWLTLPVDSLVRPCVLEIDRGIEPNGNRMTPSYSDEFPGII